MNDTLENAHYVFRAQPGQQSAFLASPADITFYGGAAGGGKTFALLLESLRHHQRPNATMAIFRRDRSRLTNPGGLWQESHKVYPHFGGHPNSQRLEWKFNSGATVSMCGLQYEMDVKKYHGAQIMLLMFDEVTEFTEYQFWYLLSRNRSDTGVPGYVRATCNPDSESWVRDLIKWWIGDDGLPIPARSGAIRWFCRVNDQTHWGDSKKQLMDRYGVESIDCKSFTFIPATIEDNQILLQNDPAYVSNLRALNEVEKQRLLFGNWKIKAEGNIFKQSDFILFTRTPSDIYYKIITVDTAQKTKESNDYSVFQCWAKAKNGIYLINQVRGRYEYPDLKLLFKSFVAKHYDVREIYIEDSVSGTALIQEVTRELKKPINSIIRSKDKYTRAYDCQGYVKSGYVYLDCMSDYYSDFIGEVTCFNAEGTHKHDDQVDCMMDAITKLLIEPPPQEENMTFVGMNSRIA